MKWDLQRRLGELVARCLGRCSARGLIEWLRSSDNMVAADQILLVSCRQHGFNNAVETCATLRGVVLNAHMNNPVLLHLEGEGDGDDVGWASQDGGRCNASQVGRHVFRARLTGQRVRQAHP